MHSDKSPFYTYKYLPLGAGSVVILMTVFMHVFPERSTVNGEPGPLGLWNTLLFLLIGTAFILISVFLNEKLVLVELTDQYIYIKKGGKSVPVEWTNVTEVEMLPIFFPPLYKLRIRNFAGYFLFTTKEYGAHAVFFVWDWSDMGSFIKKKKKELGI